jgi:hypothetical protein
MVKGSVRCMVRVKLGLRLCLLHISKRTKAS